MLKLTASVLMIADHAANQFPVQTGNIILNFGLFTADLHTCITNVSRICFPIYAFLLTEGFIRTHNRKKYGWNLFLFAVISEIAWNLEHTGTLFYAKQNVMFTLLFGYLGLCVIDAYKEDSLKQFGYLLILLILSAAFNADYGISGFGFILMIFVLRESPVIQAIIGSTILSSRWIAGLAFIPINMYSGKRGFASKPIFKYFFYTFYPLHLLIIYIIKISTIGY